MQLHLVLFAILLPILIIEWPTIQKSIDMGVTGTYDVLVFSFLLPQDQILKLLPSSLRSQESFLPVPSNVINTLKSNSLQDAGTEVGTLHPVLLQMGYQISTGPGPTWIPKFSFNEAKLEVPYLRHPSGKSSLAYVLKQLMWVLNWREGKVKCTLDLRLSLPLRIFSNPIIKMGSSATGLRSSTATFSPSSTPSHALAGSTELQYAASGYFEATATKSADTSTASWDVYRDMMENWWFGAGTGEVTQKVSYNFRGRGSKGF